MARLFGFSIDDSNKKSPSALSPIPQNNEDGVDHYLTSGFFGSYVDIEGVYRTEFDLIKRYREMSLHPEVDSAIEDIVNEAIVSDTNDSPVQIELSNLNASDGLKKKIREEFKYILELLDFDKKAHEIYRNWYIDGRLYYHKVIDLKRPHDGIQELRYIDSMKMRYVRQEKKGKKDQLAPRTTNSLVGDQNPMNFKFPEIEEYFIYDPKSSYPVGGGVANMGTASPDRGVKIAKDAITYCTSGLVDRNKGTTLSYLNKAIKALNQLRMIEDSLVIYRLCLIGDTRVKTDTGYSYIKDLNVGDTVYAYDNRVDSLVKTQVTNKWMTGTKKTYTVKSKHHNITGTDTHPVLVYDSTTKEVKYIPIKDLEPKIHSLTYIKPESTNDVVLFSHEIGGSEFVTPDFSRLFGFLMGSGSIENNIITFTKSNNEAENEYYSDLIKNYFDGNSIGRNILDNLGIKENRIPNWVFNTSNEIKKQIILGLLDSKGHYEDFIDGFSCKISLSNKQLIEDIKELWTSIGLCSGNITPNEDSYELYLSEYELPKFEKIMSVEYHSEEEVYDIEVEHEKHNFVANGIVVHNSRAPERRIFYIDVGNLPKVKAEQYLRDVMMRYRNKLVYDACLSMDTKVPLLDGRTLTLSEITEEFNKGERLWTYSCDPNTGKFAPGIISWAGVTRKNEKVVKLTLDNDEIITCTLDHKFPVWNKGTVEAKDLQIGDSMIPFYSKEKEISSSSPNSKYTQIFENETKKWKFVHRLVSEWKDENNILNEYNYNKERELETKKTVHHINYDRYNNAPENLVRMSRDDHFDYHKQHCSEAGKIGGKVCAQRKRENGIPFFNMTHEQIVENSKQSGKLGGLKSYENKSGIHGLDKEEIVKNAKNGSDALTDKLKNDMEFYEKFCEAISLGWKEEERNQARIRGKNIPNPHFVEMNRIANISRWEGEDSQQQRKNHSKKQSIEYTDQIFDLLNKFTTKETKLQDALNYLNKNIDFNAWKEINSNKNPRKGKGNCDPLEKFSYTNLINVCKKMGYSSWKEYKNSIIYKNHKIKNIEFLEETMDVGTLTIDKEELYHNYHTFALSAGIYTCNSTGEIRDDKKFMSMLEDFWLPRREGGRGTEIDTLPGGQNLGEITDINYFQSKLYKALNVPSSRIDGESGFNLGRSSEILRDELKFSKFVGRLRKRFSNMFSDMLKTQLILKNIITPEDWEQMNEHIQYDFLYDNHFAELKDSELMTDRLNMLSMAEPYIGKYYSQDYVRRNILRQTDQEIVEQDELIKKEIEQGIIPDPSIPVDPNTGMPLDTGNNIEGEMGKVPIEPQVSEKGVEPPKGGEI